MARLDVSSMEVTDLVKLPTGCLFFHQAAQVYDLAIVLESTTTHAFWLNLTGKDAFLTEAMQLTDKYRVLNVGLDPKKIQVRVAGTAKPSSRQSHQRGRVMFNRGCPASITVGQSTDLLEHQRVVRVSTWELEQLEHPGGMEFESWSLGFVDDAGVWVSVLDVNP